jgi:hypothetical protein
MNSLQDISKCFSYFYKDTHQKTGFYVKKGPENATLIAEAWGAS